MMKTMTFNLLKIFLILYFVKPSVEQNKTERNGKVFREYFFLAKLFTLLLMGLGDYTVVIRLFCRCVPLDSPGPEIIFAKVAKTSR